MLNDFELYNVHAESAELKKCSILNTKIDYVEYNKKELPTESNSVTLKEIVKKSTDNCSEIQPCQKINVDSMTQELQADYLHR